MVDREQEITEAAWLAGRFELGRGDAAALCRGGLTLGYLVENLDDGAAFVERALVLNSNLAVAWSVSGWMKLCFGSPDTAINRQVVSDCIKRLLDAVDGGAGGSRPAVLTRLLGQNLNFIVAVGAINQIGDQPRNEEDSDDHVTKKAEVVVQRPNYAPEAAAVG
jgi:hypothetical protein